MMMHTNAVTEGDISIVIDLDGEHLNNNNNDHHKKKNFNNQQHNILNEEADM